MSEQEYAVWCRQTVALVALGGIWVVPRSGQVYTKNSETEIALTQIIPSIEGDQVEEFLLIKKYMEMAGITVLDHMGLVEV